MKQLEVENTTAPTTPAPAPSMVELSLNEVKWVAGGPQVTNDGVIPPPAVAPLRS